MFSDGIQRSAPAFCWTLMAFLGIAQAEPPAIDPFGERSSAREDAVAGCLELSDGTVHVGMIYLTRDKRLPIYDDKLQRQREIPLTAVTRIDASIKKEWMEKEWRFKESANDQKVYTGREYPAREYTHTLTLKDGRTITGPLQAIIYVQPKQQDYATKQFILHKRDKGTSGQGLKDLLYVKQIRVEVSPPNP